MQSVQAGLHMLVAASIFGIHSVSADVPRCGAMTLAVASIEAPPKQYVEFRQRRPESCVLTGEVTMEWSHLLHDLLTEVNEAVNAEIELVSDPDNLGVEERWDIPSDCRGDCEDFALVKRERLKALGIPSAALTMAIGFHEVQFFPHAVLLVETTTGTWVLDNLYDDVLCWDALPYRYSRRERTDGQWTRFKVH
jgi:predicted transglutaminase-like cysteine proteinase